MYSSYSTYELTKLDPNPVLGHDLKIHSWAHNNIIILIACSQLFTCLIGMYTSNKCVQAFAATCLNCAYSLDPLSLENKGPGLPDYQLCIHMLAI